MRKEDLSRIFEEKLREQAERDAVYFRNPNPSKEERAEYSRRTEEMDRLRQEFYTAVQTQKATGAEASAGPVVIADWGTEAALSASECRLAHKLNTGLQVVLGCADLLAERISEDDAAMAELERLRSLVQKMADLVRNSRCKAYV